MTVSITLVPPNPAPPADIMLNSRPNVSALPSLMAEEPVIPVISPSVLPEAMRPQPRAAIAVPLLLITAEPVTPAKTTLARPATANPPAAAAYHQTGTAKTEAGSTCYACAAAQLLLPRTEHKLQARRTDNPGGRQQNLFLRCQIRVLLQRGTFSFLQLSMQATAVYQLLGRFGPDRV